MNMCKPSNKRFFLVSFLAGVALYLALAGPGLATDGVFQPPKVIVGGTGSSLGAISLIAQDFMENSPSTDVKVLPSLGSGGGIKALLQDGIDFSFSARPLKDREILQGLSAVEYARAPIVFATTANLEQTNISLSDLERMYSGEMQAWPDGSPIHLVMRSPKESETLFLKSLSPSMEQAVDNALKRQGMMFALTDQEAANQLESRRGALTSLSLGQLMSESRKVKILSFNNTPSMIKGRVNSNYPFFKTYYLVFRPNVSPEARKFLEYILSERGREILEQNGHICP